MAETVPPGLVAAAHDPRPPAPAPFPLHRWGREDSAASQAARWLAGTRPGFRLLRLLVPLDRRLLWATRGRYSIFGPLGAPILLLTTTGARTGQSRVVPLVYLAAAPAGLAGPVSGPSAVVAGCDFGRAAPPSWSTNLLASPEALVEIDGEELEVVARLLDGAERDRAWQRFTDGARLFRTHQALTGRRPRVFVLERVPLPPP